MLSIKRRLGNMPVYTARRLRLARSESMESATPGYWTLMATSEPPWRSTPRCTWPMDAEAMGSSPKERSFSRQPSPSSASRVRSSCSRGMVCADARTRLKTACSWGGTACSSCSERIWPTLSAAPRSLLKVPAMSSALRSLMTTEPSSSPSLPLPPVMDRHDREVAADTELDMMAAPSLVNS